MTPSTITADDIENYFIGFATRLFHTPAAPHFGELAATSKAIPAPLLVDLTAKLAQLDPRASARPWQRASKKRWAALDRLPITQKVLPDGDHPAGSARALGITSPSDFKEVQQQWMQLHE